MARAIPVRTILRLRASGLSGNAITRSQRVSKTSVTDTFHAADGRGVSWEDVEGMPDREAYALLFPERVHDGPVYPDPDWDRVHRELARVGVTLKRLHAEYRDEAAAKDEPAMSYDRFCKRCREFAARTQVAGRVGRKAGRTMEVDWAGPTMRLVDPATGEVSKVCLFVACLPLGRMSYVEPTLDMKQDTWLRCHARAFAYFGGSVPCIVPDNLKTGVRRHPRDGEAELSDACREMAARYGAAVMPARVKTPHDKPSVENEVWQAAAEIVAALRDEVFTDLGGLRRAVAERLEEHNSRPFSKREGTRRQVFEEQERPLLRTLPAVPYEVCEWVCGRKVQKNCRVSYRRNFYSVSHLAVGKSVDLRVTDTTLEVYLGGERLATHPLFPPFARNRYSAHEGDMPEGKAYREWDAARIRRRADRVGPSCREVVDRIFQRVEFEEQGCNAAPAVLRLSHKYSAQRLERACRMALASGRPSPRYRDLEPVLETSQDRLADARAGDDDGGPGEDEAGYVRGAEFYGEGM